MKRTVKYVIGLSCVIGAAVGYMAFKNKKHQTLKEASERGKTNAIKSLFYDTTFDDVDKAMAINEGRTYINVSDEKETGHTDVLEFLNTATPNELMEIKGIGKVTAKRIVMARPLASIGDLESIPRIPTDIQDRLNMNQ